jgi:ribosomal-protein-alanine N-acetyltransferase
MNKTQPILRSSRLVLRQLSEEDNYSNYYSWMNDLEVTRYLESRFENFSEKKLIEYAKEMNANENILFYGVFLVKNYKHIGNIKLNVNFHHRRGELGLVIGDKAQWGKGFAVEAINSMVSYAFKNNLHKITAGCYSDNIGSLKAFEKAGFKIDSRRKRHYIVEDRYNDLIQLVKFTSENSRPK